MSGPHPPLIVRVAGLPAEAVAPFSHPGLTATLAERECLRERLGEVRAALVDCLHGAIGTAAREERRFLLSVKRSCYNGGGLKAFRQDPQWPLLARAACALVDAAVALESAADEAEARFEDRYGRALRHEQEALVRLLDNRAFVRGVALASPDLAGNLDRLHGGVPDSFGRRERRLCLTLLRYASRAALKLSPFSTLTRTGLGLVTGEAPADFALLSGGAWRERSTASLRCDLLAQCCCLLLRCPSFAEGLEVALNETLAVGADGRCSFFRPGRWEFDDETRAFSYCDASSVKVRLEGPLILWLLAELREESWIYRHLRDQARTALENEDGDLIAQGLAELLEIGFLNLVLPWDFSAPHLEQQMLSHFDAMAGEAELAGFHGALRELTQLLGGYAEAASPAKTLEASQRGVEELFRTLAPAAGLDSRIEFSAYQKTFEEDVFLLPESDGGTREIVRLSRDRMRELLEHLDPLARLTALQSSLHDLRHTLAAFGERRWPGAVEVGLLEFFAAARPLFDQYLLYKSGLSSGSAPTGFNPLDLEAVRSLCRSRQKVQERLSGCFEEGEEGQRLCPQALAALLAEVPDDPACPHAFCAFVQPLDPGGQRWVLNSIADGFGRLGSRFTSSMDARTRDDWTSYFTARSLFELGGERVELVDVPAPENRTINVHAPQTYRVLKMPGEHASAERLLRLNDLRVRLRGADFAPVLTDASGKRILPVPLGSLAVGGRPTLLKFLVVFGPREFRAALPTRMPRVEDGVRVLDRHFLGRIVYARKRWVVKPQQLRSMMEGCGEAASYAAVNRWRLTKGIPDRTFVREPIVLAGSLYRLKPQYIDFSSPSFVQIFRSILGKDIQALVLEEALPVPEQFPIHGNRWAVEIQLESFGFWHSSLTSREARE